MARISGLLILLWALPVWLYGQHVMLPDSISFGGIVLNEETSVPMSDVTCRYGKTGTITNTSGRFGLRAAVGDTVHFSYVGFRPYAIVIPDTLYEDEYMLGIFLSPDTIMLSEALILKRFGDKKRQNLMNARNNMAGVMRSALNPELPMDAGMNQRMMINEFARSIEMKGHVDVRVGVGLESLEAWKQLKMQSRIQNSEIHLEADEVGLLKKIYYLEKREKADI